MVVAALLAGIMAVVLLPSPTETTVAQAVVRAPGDLTSSNVIGLYISNFQLGMAAPETAAVVTGAVPEITALEYQQSVETSRQGTSVLFNVSLEHPDSDTAVAALDAGLRETIQRLGSAPLEGPHRTGRAGQGRTDRRAAAGRRFHRHHRGLRSPRHLPGDAVGHPWTGPPDPGGNPAELRQHLHRGTRDGQGTGRGGPAPSGGVGALLLDARSPGL